VSISVPVTVSVTTGTITYWPATIVRLHS
jgi:hypothetical protein